MANNSSAQIKAKGLISFQILNDGCIKNIELRDTLFVPDLRLNLLSISKITDNGYRVLFEKDAAKFITSNGDTLLIANKTNGLYCIQLHAVGDYMVGVESTKPEKDLLAL